MQKEIMNFPVIMKTSVGLGLEDPKSNSSVRSNVPTSPSCIGILGPQGSLCVQMYMCVGHAQQVSALVKRV